MSDENNTPQVQLTSLTCEGMDGCTATLRDDKGQLVQEVFAAPKTNALQTFPEVKEL